jgi:hypothetical protein
MPEYLCNPGGHGITLSSGQPLAPGDTIEADSKDPHLKALVEAGHLIKLDDPKEKK